MIFRGHDPPPPGYVFPDDNAALNTAIERIRARATGEGRRTRSIRTYGGDVRLWTLDRMARLALAEIAVQRPKPPQEAVEQL